MTQRVWDPIAGQTTATVPEQAEVSVHPLAGLVRSLTLPGLVLCLVGFGVAVASDRYMFHGIAVATICFVFILFGSSWTGETRNRQSRIANATRAAGHLGGMKLNPEKIAALTRRIKSLMTLRVGGSIPLVLEHEIWGTTTGGIPFWMGLSLHPSQVFLGGPKANAAIDPASSHGEVAMFVVAYQLERDTNLHAEIMPEFVTAKGPLDQDVKTESIEFNAKYNIRLRVEDGEEVAKGQSSAGLLRVLTPATQAILIDLADTYAARIIIDHDTVFFGGYRNFQTTDPAALQRLLTQAIADFAAAATAFKTYAE